MADREMVLEILKQALEKEKQAEQNCYEILKQLQAKGEMKVIQKIKNDEHHHQEIVNELLSLI